MSVGLVIRKLADRRGERVAVKDKDGKNRLYNPATEKLEDWPLLGVLLESTPLVCRPSTKIIQRLVEEGIAKRLNERAVVRPGGPPKNPFAKTHTFIHCDEVHLYGVNDAGQPVVAKYRVVEQPDKYPCSAAEALDGLPEKHWPAQAPEGGFRVAHFYTLELINVEPRG